MKLINPRQALFEKAAKKRIPIYCLRELTYRCNLKCIHCYIVKRKKRELDKWGFFKILEQLQDAGCLYLTFSGGEILVRKDFFEIAVYARKLNFALILFTNGTLINEEIADKIRKLMPVAVDISLYGFRSTHDKITQLKGSFDKTVKAIRLLRQREINVYAKPLLMNQNVEEIWQLNRFIENNLGAKLRGIGAGLLISPCDDGNKRPLNYRLNDRQLRRYIEGESKQFKFLGREYKPVKVKEKENLCGAGLNCCNISPYGELNPCVQMRIKDNNLKDKSFIKTWKEHKDIERLRKLRMIDRKDCLGCKLSSYCATCPGIAQLEEGSLLAKLPEACRQSSMRKEIYGNG